MTSACIERILNSGFRAVLVTAGGGSGALHALLVTPGASRFVEEAYVPYSPDALERFLGGKPEHAVSPETARQLARQAFKFHVSGFKQLSVSCTAALQTDRERRGDDRAFICIKTAESEKLYALCFSKTSRADQEHLLSDWLLVLIAQAVGAERGLILPGSFNPVHRGHIHLLKTAEEMTRLRGIFELSCVNVDKPDIPETEALRRIAAIRDIPVALTRAPRFVQKAQLFPQSTFVLGCDTAERLIGYAQPGEWELFQTLETSFLAAYRFFQTLETLRLPAGFETLFTEIPEEKFREDISSSELRKSDGV